MASTLSHRDTVPPSSGHRQHARQMRANQSLWDAWTRLHLAPGVYGVEAFRAGACTLKPIELEELGDVSGKSMLHLQCHFGLDTLSWARRGAVVTGVDFSPEAIRAATALGTELRIPARFVCANLYDLETVPELRGERFDIVFTSYGVLCWLPDLAGWARVIAHFLKPGGTFYKAEWHPFANYLFPRETDSEGNPIREPYFGGGEPVRAVESGSYAAPAAGVKATAYYWSHGVGEVVTALCDAGLRLDYPHEFPPEKQGGLQKPEEGERRDYPAWYSIRATKPGSDVSEGTRSRRG